MRIGGGGAESEAAAGFAFIITGDAEVVGIINKHVRIACFDAGGTEFIVSDGAINTVAAGVDASFAFWVARLAFSINGKIVGWAVSHANSFQSISEFRFAGSTVVGINRAGSAHGVTSFTFVHLGLVESFGTVEGANSTDHDVGAFIVASSVVEYLSFGAAGTSGVQSEASLAAIGTILTGSIDGVGSDRAVFKASEVEEISAARLAGCTFGGVFGAGLTRRVAINTG